MPTLQDAPAYATYMWSPTCGAYMWCPRCKKSGRTAAWENAATTVAAVTKAPRPASPGGEGHSHEAKTHRSQSAEHCSLCPVAQAPAETNSRGASPRGIPPCMRKVEVSAGRQVVQPESDGGARTLAVVEPGRKRCRRASARGDSIRPVPGRRAPTGMWTGGPGCTMDHPKQPTAPSGVCDVEQTGVFLASGVAWSARHLCASMTAASE